MGHYVYKYVHNDEIIYIGKNDTNLESRIKQHERERKFKKYLSSDIYYIELSNRAESKALEALLINKYKPKLNVVDVYETSSNLIQFVEPTWLRYCGQIKKEKSQNCVKKKEEGIRKIHIIPNNFQENHLEDLKWIYDNRDNVIVKENYVYLKSKRDDLAMHYCIESYTLLPSGKKTKVQWAGLPIFGSATHTAGSEDYLYRGRVNEFEEFIRCFETIPLCCESIDWDDAYDVDSEERIEITYTSRFRKPEWI